tara:strand:- start:33 stop:230 length:198 start_codon:yes stop_codon:yes gene_type:complete
MGQLSIIETMKIVRRNLIIRRDARPAIYPSIADVCAVANMVMGAEMEMDEDDIKVFCEQIRDIVR